MSVCQPVQWHWSGHLDTDLDISIVMSWSSDKNTYTSVLLLLYYWILTQSGRARVGCRLGMRRDPSLQARYEDQGPQQDGRHHGGRGSGAPTHDPAARAGAGHGGLWARELHHGDCDAFHVFINVLFAL